MGGCPWQAAPPRVARIGYLASGGADASRSLNAFREGLRDQGYLEGANLVIETRFAEGQPERLPALAAELAQLPVDVLVTTGSAYQAACNATTGTPIVFATSVDPVGEGVVSSLAHPGGNLTGLSYLLPPLLAKQLELPKEAIPATARVVALRAAAAAPSAADLLERTLQTAAGVLSLELQFFTVRSPDEVAAALQPAVPVIPLVGGLLGLGGLAGWRARRPGPR